MEKRPHSLQRWGGRGATENTITYVHHTACRRLVPKTSRSQPCGRTCTLWGASGTQGTPGTLSRKPTTQLAGDWCRRQVARKRSDGLAPSGVRTVLKARQEPFHGNSPHSLPEIGAEDKSLANVRTGLYPPGCERYSRHARNPFTKTHHAACRRLVPKTSRSHTNAGTACIQGIRTVPKARQEPFRKHSPLSLPEIGADDKPLAAKGWACIHIDHINVPADAFWRSCSVPPVAISAQTAICHTEDLP